MPLNNASSTRYRSGAAEQRWFIRLSLSLLVCRTLPKTPGVLHHGFLGKGACHRDMTLSPTHRQHTIALPYISASKQGNRVTEVRNPPPPHYIQTELTELGPTGELFQPKTWETYFEGAHQEKE